MLSYYRKFLLKSTNQIALCWALQSFTRVPLLRKEQPRYRRNRIPRDYYRLVGNFAQERNEDERKRESHRGHKNQIRFCFIPFDFFDVYILFALYRENRGCFSLEKWLKGIIIYKAKDLCYECNELPIQKNGRSVIAKIFPPLLLIYVYMYVYMYLYIYSFSVFNQFFFS